MIRRTKFALLLPCWDGHKFSIILEKNGLAVVLVPGLRQLSKNSVQLYSGIRAAASGKFTSCCGRLPPNATPPNLLPFRPRSNGGAEDRHLDDRRNRHHHRGRDDDYRRRRHPHRGRDDDESKMFPSYSAP